VAEQILPILKRYTGRPQSAPEGMLEVMHPDSPESFRAGFARVLFVTVGGFFSDTLPCVVVYSGDGFFLEGEDEFMCDIPKLLDH